MNISQEKDTVFSETMKLLSSYLFTGTILWIINYLVFAYLMKALHRNYLKNSDDLEKLCSCIVENRVADCVRILEKKSEYVNKYAKNGYTPFLLACSTGNTQILKIMLKKGNFNTTIFNNELNILLLYK